MSLVACPVVLLSFRADNNVDVDADAGSAAAGANCAVDCGSATGNGDVSEQQQPPLHVNNLPRSQLMYKWSYKYTCNAISNILCMTTEVK